MKRCWIGLGLLLVLLAAGVAVTWAMDSIHDPIAEDLNQAAECILLGDWDSAERFFLQARGEWEKWENFRACFADHNPVEEIGANLAMAEIYRAAREDVAFAAACAEAAEKIEAVGDAHGLFWWNVL